MKKKSDKLIKNVTIFQKLHEEISVLKKHTVFQKSVFLNKSEAKEKYYAGDYFKRKGVKFEQILILPVRSENFNVAISINKSIHDDKIAEITFSSKINDENLPKIGFILSTEPMDYKSFKTKLRQFNESLLQDNDIRKALSQVFFITIPEPEQLSDFLIEKMLPLNNQEGKIIFGKKYIKQLKETSIQQLNDENKKLSDTFNDNSSFDKNALLKEIKKARAELKKLETRLQKNNEKEKLFLRKNSTPEIKKLQDNIQIAEDLEYYFNFDSWRNTPESAFLHFESLLGDHLALKDGVSH